jgi:K+-transporting ATPase c subunit
MKTNESPDVNKLPDAPAALAPVSGSVAGPTIADAIAEYKATRGSSAVKLLHKVLDKIIGLKCPHCHGDVNITIKD